MVMMMENEMEPKENSIFTPMDVDIFIEALKALGYTYDEVAQRLWSASNFAVRLTLLVNRVEEVNPHPLREFLTEEEWAEFQRLTVAERDCDKDSLI